LTRERLLMLDAQLQDCRRNFDQLEKRQAALLDELTKEKANYTPGSMTPTSILARQRIEQLMSEGHQITDESRLNTDEAGRFLGGLVATPNVWRLILQRAGNAQPQPNDAMTSITRARLRRALN